MESWVPCPELGFLSSASAVSLPARLSALVSPEGQWEAMDTPCVFSWPSRVGEKRQGWNVPIYVEQQGVRVP